MKCKFTNLTDLNTSLQFIYVRKFFCIARSKTMQHVGSFTKDVHRGRLTHKQIRGKGPVPTVDKCISAYGIFSHFSTAHKIQVKIRLQKE